MADNGGISVVEQRAPASVVETSAPEGPVWVAGVSTGSTTAGRIALDYAA
ncbi:hypothetical protein [Nocardioides endophyticus]